MFPRGGGVVPKDDPPPNFGHFWVVLGGVVPDFALNKAVPYALEQSCSAMATQKMEETE